MARLAADHRRSELAQIHMGAKALGMDPSDKDEGSTYRTMLWTIGRVRSSAELDWTGRKRIIDHLKACGWKPAPPRKAASRKMSDEAQHRMIRGLWLELADAGVVKNRSEEAIAAFVKRMTGVEALQWLSGAQASRVIEHLKNWRDRAHKAAA